MRRLRTPDWEHLGWHYRAMHMQTGWHNRLFLRANGLANVPREGGFVFAANHSSWWDPVAVAATVGRPVNFLGKKEVFDSKFGAWFFGGAGGIPVDRAKSNPEAYAKAVAALKGGRIVGVFPEGTRHVGKLGPARSGVARLAMEAGAPVVPVGVASDEFWGPGARVPKLSKRIYVNIGAPFYLEGDHRDAEEARRGTDEVMGVIAKLLDQARAARDARAKWAVP